MAAPAPAASTEQPLDGEAKKKSPLIKIILMVVAVILLIGLSAGGTLLATGFFSKKNAAEDAVGATLDKLDAQAKGDDGLSAGAKDDGRGAPAKDGGQDKKDGAAAPMKELVSPSPDNQRWKYNYFALEKPLVSNLTNSRKVMQVQLTVMTHYDERVITNMKTHELAIRAGILDRMRMTTEAEMTQPDFRKALAEDIRLVVNSLLEKYEGFGGIEEIHFTDFVVQ